VKDLPVFAFVRLILEDRPGALSRAAAGIADVGGNIIWLDVVERDDAIVVDDFIVELAEISCDELAEHLSTLPGVVVDCVRVAPAFDLHQEIELISSLASHPRPSLDLFARLVPAIVRCDWAVVISSVGPAHVITHASANGPRIRWASLPWVPIEKAVVFDAGEDWIPSAWHSDTLALVAVPITDNTCVLTCRKTGPQFRPSEVKRLSQLGLLAGRLLATAPDRPRS
jgi:hypothetical protein